MNVLLFGGTRFIGKSLVYRLLSLGHFVTVVSRRNLSQKENLTCWVGERSHSYADLKLQAFDCIIDFIAYSENEVSDTLNAFPGCPYVLISTCWIDALDQQAAPLIVMNEDTLSRNLERRRRCVISVVLRELLLFVVCQSLSVTMTIVKGLVFIVIV